MWACPNGTLMSSKTWLKRAGGLKGDFSMDLQGNATQAMGFNDCIIEGDAVLNQSEEAKGVENPGTNLRLNEVTTGMLGKTVDTAVAVTQFAVGATIGMGQITLGTVSRMFMDATETLNKQFNGLVNRVLGVRG
jgi:hypothetical protein